MPVWGWGWGELPSAETKSVVKVISHRAKFSECQVCVFGTLEE